MRVRGVRPWSGEGPPPVGLSVLLDQLVGPQGRRRGRLWGRASGDPTTHDRTATRPPPWDRPGRLRRPRKFFGVVDQLVTKTGPERMGAGPAQDVDQLVRAAGGPGRGQVE